MVRLDKFGTEVGAYFSPKGEYSPEKVVLQVYTVTVQGTNYISSGGRGIHLTAEQADALIDELIDAKSRMGK